MRLRRVPDTAEPNRWSRHLEALCRDGAPLLDLTETNPTRVGLGGGSPELLAALADPAALDYAPDPRGDARARAAVAAYYARRGDEVLPGQVVLTSGTSEGYAHLFRLLCAPGERVLVPRPSYPLFEPIAEAEGVRTGFYPLTAGERWSVDLAALEAAFDPGTRAIVVVQPHHPTGWCASPEERSALERIAAERDVALIVDEVFADFPDPASGPAGVASFAGARRATTFVLSGLSKVCGLPQMKLGWIVAAGPERERAEALRGLEWLGDLFLSVSLPVQLATPRFLESAAPFQERLRARVSRNRARMRARVSEAPHVRLLPSEGGWMACLELPKSSSDEDWSLALMDRGVIVQPGYFYDFAEEAVIVTSLLTEPADWDLGIERILGATR